MELTPIIFPDAGLAIPIDEQTANHEAVLAEGVERLKALGFSPTSMLETGDAEQKIAELAEEIGALSSLVIGRRDRWSDGGSALSAAI